MHESRAQANAPERCGPDLVARALEVLPTQVIRHHLVHAAPVVFASRLQDAVSSPDVVHEKIAERMERDGSERGGNRIRSAVDPGAAGRGGPRFDVALRASDSLEESNAHLRHRARG